MLIVKCKRREIIEEELLKKKKQKLKGLKNYQSVCIVEYEKISCEETTESVAGLP